MIQRENKLSETAVKNAIKLSKTCTLTSVRRVMQNANMPDHIIERVLYEPNKIRCTDLLD